MNRDDFEILKTGLIYFDNGATTLKPTIMLKELNNYYTKYTANAHRGDYKNSVLVSDKYEGARTLIKDFINAESSSEIIFSSGTTDSLNKVIFGFFRNYLKKGDEVLLTKAEHASLLLPWFELADQIGIVINFIPLNEDHAVTIDNVSKAVNPKTKVISLAHITNVIGDIRPIKEICDYANKLGILTLIDGAQSVPHMPVDVTDLNVSFLTFSAHKMCGPTGVGVIYGKAELLRMTKPITFGGGMNISFNEDGTKNYKAIPHSLEAGTPNIAGVLAFGEVIKYLNKIGMKKIHDYELELRSYAISKLKDIAELSIYNQNSDTGIISFNYEGIFAQDLAVYLDKHNVNVRSGNHCAKILIKEIGVKNTVRMSLYFYNTKEEIDIFVDLLKNPNIKQDII